MKRILLIEDDRTLALTLKERLEKENYRMVGQRTKKIYTFGDAVKVQVKETNLARRSMDLYLAGTKGKSFSFSEGRSKGESERGNRNAGRKVRTRGTVKGQSSASSNKRRK